MLKKNNPTLDITADEIDLLDSYSDVIDRYIGYFEFTLDEIITIVESIDTEKAEALISISTMFFDKQNDELGLIIKIANLADVLLRDESDNVATLFTYLTAIYFDVTNDFDVPDEIDVADIQTTVETHILNIFTEANEVKDFNPTYLSPTDVYKVYQIFANIQAIGTWFDEGFESAEDTVVVYSDYYLKAFLDDESFAEALLRMEDILGTTNAEETYYALRSILQYLNGLTAIEDFNDLQVWVSNLESFGFTQGDLIDILVNYMKYAISDAAIGDDAFHEVLDEIEESIEEYEGYIDDYEDEMEFIDNMVRAAAANLDSGFDTIAIDYWENLLIKNQLDYQRENAIYSLWGVMDYEDVQDLESVLMTMAIINDPLNSEYIAAVAQYNAIYNNQDEEVQEQIDDFQTILYEYIAATQAAADAYGLLINGNPDAITFVTTFSTSMLNEYMINYINEESCYDRLNEFFEEKDEMLASLARMLLIQEFMDVLDNEIAVENVLGIVLDDVENMM